MGNTPKLRFEGFSETWEQRKLSQLMDFSNGFNGGKEVYGDGINFISVMDILNNDYITYDCIRGKAKLDEKELDRFKVEYGDVLFQRSSENVDDAGRSNVYVDANPAAYGGFVIRGKKKSDYDVFFMKHLLDSGAVRSQIRVRAQGAQHINVSQEVLSDVEVNMPSNIEQKHIGELLHKIDRMIASIQRKHDVLILSKQFYLQNMFPRSSECAPRIRFDGFSGEWVHKRLGDILRIVTRLNGERYTISDVLSVSDEHGCINQIKFQGRSFAGDDISNYKVVKSGDIVYTRSPLQSKPFGIIKIVGTETGIVSPLYIVNAPIAGNDSEFIYYSFDTPQKTNRYLSPLVRKGAKNTMNISNDEWLSGDITVAPSYDEQKMIGAFFRQMDSHIILYQQKTDAFRDMKKFLLQNMFA